MYLRRNMKKTLKIMRIIRYVLWTTVAMLWYRIFMDYAFNYTGVGSEVLFPFGALVIYKFRSQKED
jgi:hypothetical protein